MKRILCKSKIHRATVTDSNLNYNGSITIDRNLMDAANLIEYEQVHVANISNGNRLITYVIEGERSSGIICLNGAAAHLISPGDLVIIMSYAEYDEKELLNFKPQIILVDDKNKMN